MEKLILWKVNPAWLAKDRQTRFKSQMMMLEWIKAEIKAKQHKSWGISANGMSGYSLTDMSDEDLFVAIAKYQPIIEFKIETMLDVDECIECNNRLAKAMEK
ncbi:MAG TPA: hypothetical protein VMW03_02005 [Candidatus Krumholzibacteriaceae bacterium]|nr:hypothetical protein [Candidatus Krumholzibacteriaceae bacterium]